MANPHLEANQPQAGAEAAHIQDVLAKGGADAAYKALIGDSLSQTKDMSRSEADNYRTALTNDLENKGILPQLSAAYLYENRGHLQTGQELPGYDMHTTISEATVQGHYGYVHSFDGTKMQFDHTSLNEALLREAATHYKDVTGADSGVYVDTLGAGLKREGAEAVAHVHSVEEANERSAHLQENRKDFQVLLNNNGQLFNALVEAGRDPDGPRQDAITTQGVENFLADPFHNADAKAVAAKLLTQLNSKHGYVDQNGIAVWVGSQGEITRQSLAQGLGLNKAS